MSNITYDRVVPDQIPAPIAFRYEKFISTPPCMLSKAEIQLLLWMSKSVYTGTGEIAELGAWLGGSSVALASGLKENNNISSKKIYVYDLFTWKRKWNQVQNYFVDRDDGESILDIYREFTKQHEDVLDIKAGDICDIGWCGKPIEILFIDIMKSPEVASSVVQKFFPYLIPGKSYILHQDFKHYYTYWIHLITYRLRNFFTPVLNLGDSSTLMLKLKKSIPESYLNKACNLSQLSIDEVHNAFRYSFEITEGSNTYRNREIIQACFRAVNDFSNQKYFYNCQNFKSYNTDKNIIDFDAKIKYFSIDVYKIMQELIANGTKDILIYGIGELGKNFHHHVLNNELTILDYIESSPTKNNLTQNSKPPLTPETALRLYPGVDVVIASKSFVNPMLQRLIEIGLDGRRVWVV